MELYDNPFSPYSFKVRAMLYEKGIAFEKRELRRHHEREMLLAINPRGEVPALVDHGVAIADSKVICAYIEECRPEPALIPSDPLERARCRYLELKSDTDIDACLFVLGLLLATRRDVAKAVPEALPRALEILRQHYAVLERELGGREWFLGSFSVVDIAIAPHLRSAAFLGHAPGAEHPGLTAWLARSKQRPSLRQAAREMAEGYAASQTDADPLFDMQRLHFRNDRIECAIRCGLGPWLLEQLAADKAFLSPLG